MNEKIFFILAILLLTCSFISIPILAPIAYKNAITSKYQKYQDCIALYSDREFCLRSI